MAVQFYNKKIIFEYDHSDEEVRLMGSVTIDPETSNVVDLYGQIYQTQPPLANIGNYSMTSINVNDIANIKYRTKASMLIDTVLSDAITQVATLMA